MKDQKHLLKNIHRRKPIHSHSQPQGSADPERAAFEEEIDKLLREKADLEGNVSEFKEQQSAAKAHLENLTHRTDGIDHRQERLLRFLEKAIQKPEFIERLAEKLESMDFSGYNKKRRLPQAEQSQSVLEMVDSQNGSRSEIGNKLRLELSPAISDMNLLSHSTQSSNVDMMMSPQGRTGEWSKDEEVRTGGLLCSDNLELSDTGASITFNMESSLSQNPVPGTQKLHTSASDDEGDGRVSCLLNLTLASSLLELNKSRDSTETAHSNHNTRTDPSPGINDGIGHDGIRKDRTSGNNNQTSHNAAHNKAAPVIQNRVNDVFWEQFLTERPGCSDTEEASSSVRANQYDQQEDKRSTKGVSRNTKSMEHLTL